MSPGRPSEQEEEFFARKEFERRHREAQAKQERLAEEEGRRLKDLHWLRCPKCGMELVEVEYKAIKIDKCEACEGIWFDAGEVDELLKGEEKGLGRILRVFR